MFPVWSKFCLNAKWLIWLVHKSVLHLFKGKSVPSATANAVKILTPRGSVELSGVNRNKPLKRHGKQKVGDETNTFENGFRRPW